MTELVTKVLELQENTPDGVIVDADTILADIMEDADFQITGIAKDLLEIWKKSSDQASIEELFYLFTDKPFEDYLEECVAAMEKQQNEMER